jgi:hypothetical protein
LFVAEVPEMMLGKSFFECGAVLISRNDYLTVLDLRFFIAMASISS